MKSGLPAALLFSTASSLETASREEVGFRIKSSSKESSLKVAGVPLLLAVWAVPRDKSSLVWALIPTAAPWGSADRAKVLLECTEGMETEVFFSGLEEEESCKEIMGEGSQSRGRARRGGRGGKGRPGEEAGQDAATQFSCSSSCFSKPSTASFSRQLPCGGTKRAFQVAATCPSV